MSVSDDEDFLSADEGDVDTANPTCPDEARTSMNKCAQSKPLDGHPAHDQSSTKSLSSLAQRSSTNRNVDEHINEHRSTQVERSMSSQSSASENDDDEDETLAERIRERNLILAKKFSKEMKQVQPPSSAPIPVKPIASRVRQRLDESMSNDTTGIDENSFIDNQELKLASSPPAPPSTPALSTSFNTSEPSMSSQFPWRQQAKQKTNIPASQTAIDSKVLQTRQALDRLAEKLCSADDKNLFEQVAEDVKKVSISANTTNRDNQPTDVPDFSLPTMSELGSLGGAIGGWGWNGATKLLASATQVTSQVGSVLDSVVQASQNLQNPTTSGAHADNEKLVKPLDIAPPAHSFDHCSKPKVVNDNKSVRDPGSTPSQPDDAEATKSHKPTIDMSAAEPLVDLTLNAMESLGKKAFDVMTERNDSGSLQIKGLGRPWEHLLNFTKPTRMEQVPTSTHEPASPKVSHSDHDRPRWGPDKMATNSEYDSSSDNATIMDPDRPMSLKNRKRRVKKED